MIMAQSIHCVCCLLINYQTQSLTRILLNAEFTTLNLTTH